MPDIRRGLENLATGAAGAINQAYQMRMAEHAQRQAHARMLMEQRFAERQAHTKRLFDIEQQTREEQYKTRKGQIEFDQSMSKMEKEYELREKLRGIPTRHISIYPEGKTKTGRDYTTTDVLKIYDTRYGDRIKQLQDIIKSKSTMYGGYPASYEQESEELRNLTAEGRKFLNMHLGEKFEFPESQRVPRTIENMTEKGKREMAAYYQSLVNGGFSKEQAEMMTKKKFRIEE